LNREILIFIWHENSFALLALRLLSPHLLVSVLVLVFSFAYLYGWMDGGPKQKLERTQRKKGSPFGGSLVGGRGVLHMINNNSVVPMIITIFFFFFFRLVWLLSAKKERRKGGRKEGRKEGKKEGRKQ